MQRHEMIEAMRALGLNVELINSDVQAGPEGEEQPEEPPQAQLPPAAE